MIQKMKDTIMRPNNTNTNGSWHISHTSSIQKDQERLILLHHARKCRHDDPILLCPVAGAQCAQAKQMWKHIAECTDNKKCSHCYASRYVLTHYRECDGIKCQICGPVREEIQRRKELQLGQQQQCQKIMNTETFSTSMTTSTSTTPRANNTALGASNRAAVPTRGEGNPMFPTLTVAICRSSDNVGRIIPVRRMRSSSSLSTLSHSSYGALSSSRGGSSAHGSSSIRSTVTANSGRTKPYFVKDRENPGIAHFCKDIKE